MSDYLGSGGGFSSARDNNLFQLHLRCLDAIEISYYLKRLKSIPRPQIIAHYFKLLGERSKKFA